MGMFRQKAPPQYPTQPNQQRMTSSPIDQQQMMMNQQASQCFILSHPPSFLYILSYPLFLIHFLVTAIPLPYIVQAIPSSSC